MKNSAIQILRICITTACLSLVTTSFAAVTVATPTPTTNQWPTYPVINYSADPQKAALIKKGEYLAKAGDCIACHTVGPNGPKFAGGLPIKTPFGTIYSSNITPDKDTGIGNWTDAQFLKAFRHGIGPDGSYYFPVFPYVYFNRLTDEDALAIKAYLDAIPPIHQVNHKVDMPIPFRWRFGQLFWRMLFFNFQQGTFQPDTHQSQDWNRGKYLVVGLGHCGLCHSPLNFLGAEKSAYFLTGGFVNGYFAPNISSSALGKLPTAEILNVFLKDQLIGGGNVQGPMLEVNHDSLKYLTPADLSSIATYLKTVKSKEVPKASAVGAPNLKVGAKIYNQYCQGCHSTGAGGAPKMGDATAWSPLIKLGFPQLYKNAIAGIDGMPAKGTCSNCSDIDIQSAVQYIVSQSGGSIDAAAAAALAPPPNPTSLAKGKEIYDKVCSACHNNGQLGAPKLGDKTAWEPLIDLDMDTLFTRAIKGYKDHPSRGSCQECTDADIIAAVKYMVQQSRSGGDYQLW